MFSKKGLFTTIDFKKRNNIELFLFTRNKKFLEKVYRSYLFRTGKK